jgi:DNA-binding NarL/FixJ family response regulator
MTVLTSSPSADSYGVASGQQPAEDKGPRLSYSILIVDDSSFVRRSLRTCLEQNPDWKVCGEAADGVDAIALSQQLRPDLILLDLSLPGMNGFEVARELKRTSPSVPVLMFTGFKTPSLESEALAAGCTAVVSKSEHQQMLFESIERLLARASSHRTEDSRSA